MSATRRSAFEGVDWQAWLRPADFDAAHFDEIAALEDAGVEARNSKYYRLLLRDAPALKQRAKLVNAVLNGPSGLSRAEREFAGVVASLVNGCIYCACAEGRLQFEHAAGADWVASLLSDSAGLTARERAIADFALTLAKSPSGASREQIAKLRAAEFSDVEIGDLVYCIAIFAWDNRLSLSLGEPVEAVESEAAGLAHGRRERLHRGERRERRARSSPGASAELRRSES